MARTVAPWIALAAFGAGLAWKISAWFRHGIGTAARETTAGSRVAAAIGGAASAVFGRKIVALLRSLWLDVVVQRRVRRESPARWLAHLAISGAFVLLLVFHALGGVVTERLFPGYAPTLNPYLFLRDLLGAALLVGLAAAAWRRLAVRVPRRDTRSSDAYALAILGVVVLSGLVLEATRIGSYSEFRSMAREYGEDGGGRAALEAFWATKMGTAAPIAPPSAELVARGREVHARSCAGCHASTRWAFLGYPAARALGPVSSRLDRIGAAGILLAVHFYACLLGLAILPFTKLFHALATPLSLMANAVVGRGRARAANVATKQMIELDACTHCCTCSVHCSMAAASDAIRNETVLPSEKIAALKALASRRPLDRARLRTLQEGVCLCTGCDRCTVSCPSGIDLLGLWLSAKEALLAMGEPEYALLSPLSMRRGLMARELDPVAYLATIDLPRASLAARSGFADLSDPEAVLAPGDAGPWTALRRSLQAGTFASCFGCKTCSTACPVVRNYPRPQQVLGLLPHQIMYAARLRLWGLALGSRMLWDCLGCYQCQEHCPQRVAVTDVLYELKNVAIARASGRERSPEPRP